jgi:hypothetical protein
VAERDVWAVRPARNYSSAVTCNSSHREGRARTELGQPLRSRGPWRKHGLTRCLGMRLSCFVPVARVAPFLAQVCGPEGCQQGRGAGQAGAVPAPPTEQASRQTELTPVFWAALQQGGSPSRGLVQDRAQDSPPAHRRTHGPTLHRPPLTLPLLLRARVGGMRPPALSCTATRTVLQGSLPTQYRPRSAL